MISISVGLGGIAGWGILQRLEGRQKAILAKDPIIQRQTRHFRDRIELTKMARDLVGDYRMLSVALGAFGLEDDIGNKAFIRKVLESDLDDRRSLANRLADKRYLRLAEEFGFQDATSSEASAASRDPGFAERISRAYLDREYERRVGLGDENLRLALNAKREIEAFASRDSSEKALWYEVLGNQPLRKVFEKAFGFGDYFAKIPVDRQLAELTKASRRLFGSSSFKTISKPENIEKITRNFLIRSEIATTSGQNRFSVALTLLSR
ncbi:DUF1217 domain-containing protein [Paracoccus methylarcula]|nr:DUF1217 domain-containing protein [Paracoccus methylarcula]